MDIFVWGRPKKLYKKASAWQKSFKIRVICIWTGQCRGGPIPFWRIPWAYRIAVMLAKYFDILLSISRFRVISQVSYISRDMSLLVYKFYQKDSYYHLQKKILKLAISLLLTYFMWPIYNCKVKNGREMMKTSLFPVFFLVAWTSGTLTM